MKKHLIITLILSILMPGIAMAMEKKEEDLTQTINISQPPPSAQCDNIQATQEPETLKAVSSKAKSTLGEWVSNKKKHIIISGALLVVGTGLAAVAWYLWKKQQEKKEKNKKERKTINYSSPTSLRNATTTGRKARKDKLFLK